MPNDEHPTGALPDHVVEKLRADAARRAARQALTPSTGAFVRFWRACNHDLPPVPSYRTERADEGGYMGMAVRVHPVTCPQCGTPWHEGAVEYAID